MGKKACSKCNLEKELTEFAIRNKKKNTFSSECKSCHKEVRIKNYDKNRQSEKARVKKRKQEIKDWLETLKSDLKCSECSEDHIATLQFHHRNPDEKEIGISETIRYGWGIPRILEEISKCDVLCANCHSKKHWKIKR